MPSRTKGTPSLLRPAVGPAGFAGPAAPAEKLSVSAQDGQGAPDGRFSRRRREPKPPAGDSDHPPLGRHGGSGTFRIATGPIFRGLRRQVRAVDPLCGGARSVQRPQVPPGYACTEALPLFAILAPEPSDFERKLKKLVRAKINTGKSGPGSREVALSHREHLPRPTRITSSGSSKINNIGKSFQEQDDFGMEVHCQRGEADLPQKAAGRRVRHSLLAWVASRSPTRFARFDLVRGSHQGGGDRKPGKSARGRRSRSCDQENYQIDTLPSAWT